MDINDLALFRHNLHQLQDILFELTIRQDEIELHGLRPVLEELSIPETLFDEVSANLVRLLRSSEYIDFRIAEELKQLVTETKIQDAITELAIKLRVAKQRRVRHGVFYPIFNSFRSIGFVFFGKNPSKIDELVAKTLTGVSRLLPTLEALETIELNRTADDDGVFKPSGIDPRIVVARIDAAIQAVQEADNIDTVQRVALITYLETAKTETKKEAPLWQKIVGILVITATILQGIAAAPDAVKNLHQALQYITGAASIPAPSPTLMLREFHPEPHHEVQPEKPPQPPDRLTEV